MATILKLQKQALIFLILLCFVQNIAVFAKDNNEQKFSKIEVDCIFPIGSSCTPAGHLRRHKLRFKAAPLDWMIGGYSLEIAAHLFETKFEDFFERIEIIPDKVVGNHIFVKDTKNGIITIHHFEKDKPLKEEQKNFRKTMLNRADEVDKIFKKSNAIGLICNRKKATLDELKSFINKFSKIYSDKKIILINIKSEDGKDITQKILFESENKNLKIIEFVFSDKPAAESKEGWLGNIDAWNKVIDCIKLNKELFSDLYNSKVEF